MKKIAIITGITGQDGAYLAQLLLNYNYKVIGITRDINNINLKGLHKLEIANDITFDSFNLENIDETKIMIEKYKPTEIYNLAAQSSVGYSFDKPMQTINFNIMSVLNILESIKTINKAIKYYQASSSEMFGKVENLPITENTVFHPVSPYGISKASAHWITVNYREAFGLFTTSGILFNHESILRGDNFIVKKIVNTLVDIKYEKETKLIVGNIDVQRDFGYAPKYIEAMYLMMQQEKGDDYIISSGISISIREIINYVLNNLNLDFSVVHIDKKFFRPSEISNIYGDNSKATKVLKWNYNMSFYNVLDELIKNKIESYD